MLLAQDGKLKFSDPVSDYVPDVPNGTNITIADLLTMRSGLYNYTNAPEFSAALDADLAKAWTPQEMLAIAFAHPPNAAPNTDLRIQQHQLRVARARRREGRRPPVGRAVPGAPVRAAEDCSRPSLPAADEASTIPAPFSHGYMYGGSAYAMIDDPYPADIKAAARPELSSRPTTPTRTPPTPMRPEASSQRPTTWQRGYERWCRARFLTPTTNANGWKARKPEDPDEPDGQKYGYGISYQRFSPTAAMYYHGGELPGFNSFMGYDPDNDVSLVIWTNLTISPVDDKTTAQALLAPILDEIYTGLSLAPTANPDDNQVTRKTLRRQMLALPARH